MADRLVEIADGFWNIRGSFKIAGLIDIGTQASLIRLASGGFALLDAYALQGEVAREVMERTDQGRGIEAILNLHPFHTVHVRAIAQQLPGARLYGTVRHVARAPELRWEALHTEDEALHELFAEDLAFTVPRGVDFVSDNEKLHFSSVLALHRASRTLHVDDTLTWVGLPLVGGLSFHPTLRSVLQPRPGAVAEFRAWAGELITLCEGVEQLCTAHTRSLPPPSSAGVSAAERVQRALQRVGKVLDAHERRFG
ncbi:MAG TPA: hypothetical protein ENK18_22325 [Deltaproteobacteria bacterium]|nr:hypothetical protein [Deltaproteobacteria bacterium]